MSYLKKIKIQNYKGFQDEQVIEMGIPIDGRSGLTIICGKNNSGKSTVIDASLKLSNDSLISEEERQNNKVVNIQFENERGENLVLQNLDNGALITKIGNWIDSSKFEIINSNRNWSDSFNPGTLTYELYKANRGETVIKSPIDGIFGAYLSTIATDKARKLRLNELMKRVFPEFNDWTIDQNQGGAFIKYTTKNGLEHKAGMLGQGVVSTMKILGYLDTDRNDKILFIDEPELALHPQAQKNLAEIFYEISLQKQVILITHSPYFIDWKQVTKKAVINRISKPEDNYCISSILKNDNANLIGKIGKITSQRDMPFLLDTTGKELFFADNIIFCEGQDDVAILKNFIEKSCIKVNFDIFGFGVASADNMIHYLGLAKSLNIKAGALFDSPFVNKKQENVERAYNQCVEGFGEISIIQHHSQDDISKVVTGIEIKPEFETEFRKIIQNFNDFFNKK